MNLRFWKKDTSPPRWTDRLSNEEKRTLAVNLRTILEPKRVLDRVIDGVKLGAQSAPLR